MRFGGFMKRLITIAFVLGTAASAAAQPAAQEAQQTVLPNVFNTSVGATLDIRMDYTDISDDNDATLIGANFLFQYLTPAGIGGYAQLPIGYLDSDFIGDDDTLVGNLEVGGVYVVRNPDTHFYVRGGFAAETADEEGDFIVPVANFVSRPADALVGGLGTSWFRAQGGLRAKSNTIVFGGSVGLDYPLDEEIDDFALLVLVGSVGIEQPGFGIAGGFTFLQNVGDDADDDDNTVSFNATVDFEV